MFNKNLLVIFGLLILIVGNVMGTPLASTQPSEPTQLILVKQNGITLDTNCLDRQNNTKVVEQPCGVNQTSEENVVGVDLSNPDVKPEPYPYGDWIWDGTKWATICGYTNNSTDNIGEDINGS